MKNKALFNHLKIMIKFQKSKVKIQIQKLKIIPFTNIKYMHLKIVKKLKDDTLNSKIGMNIINFLLREYNAKD